MAILLALWGARVSMRTPTDIFPNIDIPVISVVWAYTGLPAQQMEQQLTLFSEYSLSGNVSDIRRMESQTFDGAAVIRLFLQPDADVPTSVSQVTAISQTILRRMPPGTQPPLIIRYNASSVPVMQLSFSSSTLSETELSDFVGLRVRTMLRVIQGIRTVTAGEKVRQIMVDVNVAALREHRLSAYEVSAAVSAQNLVLPTGNAKVGEREYRVTINSSPEAIDALNHIPIKRADGRIIFLRDVAHVHDGFAVQTSLARQDGKRSVLLSILKHGDASTTEVASRIKSLLPLIRKVAPKGVQVEVLADQSTFVTNAIRGLGAEALIAACLTATMILLFLGSWRSTLIVTISIPLSVLFALIVMRALGHTINTMTLGGLALAVGVLVDDATVEIENIHRQLAMGKPTVRAILDGAQQVAVPAFVASSCIGIVFVSVFFLSGPARYLFVPLGLAVALSVMASYVLSRTLVPTMVRYLLTGEKHDRNWLSRLHATFNRGFERFQAAYVIGLNSVLCHPKRVVGAMTVATVVTVSTAYFVGRDFFPTVDAGQIRLHVTAPPGTRIEQTERYMGQVEAALKRIVPIHDRGVLLDQLGLPGGYNLAVTDTANYSSADGEILLTLKHDRTRSVADYTRQLRRELPQLFPDLTFYFQSADIVTQILNFGLPSPIDIQVSGMKRKAAYGFARMIQSELKKHEGVVDVHMAQVVNAPGFFLEVDRIRASEVGLTQRDVANNVLLLLSSSGQVSPNYWINPETGNNYPVIVQVPEYRIRSVEDIKTYGIMTPQGQQVLSDFATLKRVEMPVMASHVDVQPTYNILADIQDIDLGIVAGRIDTMVKRIERKLPPGVAIHVRGQVESMRSAFDDLGFGLILAALLVYALMVINFQSWTDPFIIIMALPGAAIGVVLALFVTRTTFNIPSLMGALMSIGVATANAILVVSFANDQRREGAEAFEAALEAGKVRLRPVLMTALAMVLGMLPMSLGLSEGAEQNAALGRAAIGGLCGATLATLFLVPSVYIQLRRKPLTDVELLEDT